MWCLGQEGMNRTFGKLPKHNDASTFSYILFENVPLPHIKNSTSAKKGHAILFGRVSTLLALGYRGTILASEDLMALLLGPTNLQQRIVHQLQSEC
jgi:hypothetical protein